MGRGKALIIGAGVSGLSTGIELAESGYDTEIWTNRDPQQTVSAKAAAFWEPFLTKDDPKVTERGFATYQRFAEMQKLNDPTMGIEPRRILTVFRSRPDNVPEWSQPIESYKRVTRNEMERLFEGTLPDEYTDGFTFETVMIEMPIYLEYLRTLFERSGNIVQKDVGNIDDALSRAETVVNCTGLGSRNIMGIADKTMIPVAGQVLRVRKSVEKTILVDDEMCTYIVPRTDNVILGGTAFRGLGSETPDPDVTKDILRRTSAFHPHLQNADVEAAYMGARPVREKVRLEMERRLGRRLVHNYGHGGSGVTLSWGCAEEVRRLLESESK